MVAAQLTRTPRRKADHPRTVRPVAQGSGMKPKELPGLSTAILQALPQPVIVCDPNNMIVFVNYAAEAFFGASLSVLSRQKLDDLIAFGSPIVTPAFCTSR